MPINYPAHHCQMCALEWRLMGLADRATSALVAVAEQLPNGGEDRPGQREMTIAVADAITDGKHLIAEAGTGTGKSLAYLVPAILSGKRTVISTATKALQDQLANKDLPFLQEHLDVPFEFAVLKGRSNYVCRQRLAELEADGEQLGLDVEDGANVDADDLDEILKWVKKTKTGDRAELKVEPSGRTWAAVSVGPTECPGQKRCPMGGTCFAEIAREQAKEAEVVVVNTYLYALDLVSDGAILEEHDVAIIDEAHQIEDIVAGAAGFELTGGRLRNLANTIKAIVADDALISDLHDIAEQLAIDLEPHMGDRLDEVDADLDRSLNRARDRANRALEALRKIPKESKPEVIGRKERASNAATHVIADIDIALDLVEGQVAWVEGQRNPALKVASIDVSGVLTEQLFAERAAILTSATIPPNLAGRLGMDAFPFEQIDVGSPFDFEEAGMLYCAAHMPDPRSDDYRDAVHNEIEALVMAAGGRTLALFTSWRSMNLAKDYLLDRLPYQLLAQGDLPKQALVDEFTDDEESVLLATMSFWQGVDIPGPSLSCVVIDRLPFPRPDDPLLSARRDVVGAAAFREIDLPRASMLLAQGAGRLIRSKDDRGVVAILDSRLATSKSYRWDLIKALPPLRRTKNRDDAITFLNTIRDGQD